MTDAPAATPLEQLIARLSVAAEEAVRAGNLDQARATAEDVQLVDPDNARAAAIIAEVNRRERSPGEERALMTILFSDLVDSTVLAGRLEPRRCATSTGCIARRRNRRSTVSAASCSSTSGDGIVATFGYPTAHEDDARRAVHAGLALISGLARVCRGGAAALPRGTEGAGGHPHRARWWCPGWRPRTPASAARSSGWPPTWPARLQSEAEPGTVVVSDVTQALVRNHFSVRLDRAAATEGDRPRGRGVRGRRRQVAGGRLDATRANKRRAPREGRGPATPGGRMGGGRRRPGARPDRRHLRRGGHRQDPAGGRDPRPGRPGGSRGRRRRRASSTTRTSRCGRCPP